MPQESASFPFWIAAAFPFCFVVLWLAVTAILGAASGWSRLEQLYPDRPEPAVASLHMQSGQLGKGPSLSPFSGVSYNGCLRFDMCLSGLRVSVWRIFGPFQRPFLVPWSEIAASEKKVFFLNVVSLRLGPSSGLALTVNRRTFAAITRSHPLPLAPA